VGVQGYLAIPAYQVDQEDDIMLMMVIRRMMVMMVMAMMVMAMIEIMTITK
jgi:hypothetical protein